VSARFPSLLKHAAKLVEIYCALCPDAATNDDGSSDDCDADSTNADAIRKYLHRIGRPISTRYAIRWYCAVNLAVATKMVTFKNLNLIVVSLSYCYMCNFSCPVSIPVCTVSSSILNCSCHLCCNQYATLFQVLIFVVNVFIHAFTLLVTWQLGYKAIFSCFTKNQNLSQMLVFIRFLERIRIKRMP